MPITNSTNIVCDGCGVTTINFTDSLFDAAVGWSIVTLQFELTPVVSNMSVPYYTKNYFCPTCLESKGVATLVTGLIPNTQ